jgi:PAS domain S-box-containing protein
MEPPEDEEGLLRSAALQNANIIRQARQRAEQELVRAKEELEMKTRELAYSLALTRATLEATTDGLLVTDAAGHVTDCNERFLEMWQIPKATTERRKHRELLEEPAKKFREPEAFFARIQEIYTSWPPETFDTLEFLDGRVYERFSKIQLVNRKPVGRVWSYRDITESKRVEFALREQTEWFSVTLSSIGDAVITVNNECRVTYMNPIAEGFTGWSTSEAAGKPLPEVMRMVNETTRQPAVNPIDMALSEGRVVGLANHTILISRNGTELPIEDSAAPIKDPSGKIIGAVMVFHDVSERREREKALARLYDGEQQARGAAEQANKAKDDFLAALSHELRTPLTPVLAILSNLSGDPVVPEALVPDLEIVRRNVEVEARLIDDLLDLTRIDRGKLALHLESVQASRLVEDAISICLNDLNSKHLSLVRELEATDAAIIGDRLRITQVLWNLLKNSIKFTPEGGLITIRTRTVSGTAGKRFQIEVQDTGMGIEPGEVERLFKAFEQGSHHVTRNFGGLGLGLAISSGIATSHGGTLTAASAGKGKGSVFTLTLPYEDAAGRSPPARLAAPAASGNPERKLRILLVEDHQDTSVILGRILRKMGHYVVQASTIVAANQAAEEEFRGEGLDLVISDLGLPDGSGLEMMKKLSGAHDVRGIALSGFGRDSDIEQSMAAGFSRHLTKPINVLALRKTIVELMAEG